MKRVISLIISIAMVASLATGLAITGLAENPGDVGYEFVDNGIKYIVTGTNIVEVIASDTDKYTGSITIPDTVTGTDGKPYKVTSIGGSAFQNCSSLESITIPSGVTSIENKAFAGCKSLTDINIPNSVKTIGNSAFDDCKGLTSVTIGSGVTKIGNYVFRNCSKLTSTTIPSGVTSIGNGAFYLCSSLESITIHSGVTSISDEAFKDCSSLKSIAIPSGVTSIGGSAFQNCSSLEKIIIPDSVTDIGQNAFTACKVLTSVTIGNGVETIGLGAFKDCTSLTDITIGSGVKTIEQSAFYGCSSLKSIKIPSGVTSIGNAAFYQCSSLESVTIGSGVKTIGQIAFFNCSALESVTVEATTPPTLTNNNAFNGCTSLEKIYVPKDAADAYKGAPGWSAYASKIVKGITINGDEIEECIGSYGGNIISRTDNTITIDKISTNTDTSIYIPIGKTLIVSNTDSDAISVYGNLTIAGGGEIDVYAFGNNSYVPAAIYAAIGDINITDECTVIAIYEGDNDACAAIFAASGNINITNESKVTAIHKGDINEVGKGLPAAAIFAFGGDISITNESTVIATHEGDNIEGIAAAICSIGKVNISDNSTVTAYASGTDVFGISGNNIDIVDANVKAKGSLAAFAASPNKIVINNETITDKNYKDYFTSDGEFAGIFNENFESLGTLDAITGTDFVTVICPTDREDLDDSAEESDPEVELDLGYGPVTLKTSNKSVVLNDKSIIEKMFNTAVEDTLVFDLTSTPVKLDGLFFNNDVFNVAKEANKKIEIDNRFAKAKVSTKNDIDQNPLSLHLSDVSEVPGTCATYIQKKAMETSKVYAQVNYSFVSNGKPTDNNAKIYVPVDGPAKVFYLFNAEKIGIVPCEVIDGYCVFNRYFDGSYVICSAN